MPPPKKKHQKTKDFLYLVRIEGHTKQKKNIWTLFSQYLVALIFLEQSWLTDLQHVKILLIVSSNLHRRLFQSFWSWMQTFCLISTSLLETVAKLTFMS